MVGITAEGERAEVSRHAPPARKTGKRRRTYDTLRAVRMRAFIVLHDRGFTVEEIALLFRHTHVAVANELDSLLKMRAEMLADG